MRSDLALRIYKIDTFTIAKREIYNAYRELAKPGFQMYSKKTSRLMGHIGVIVSTNHRFRDLSCIRKFNDSIDIHDMTKINGGYEILTTQQILESISN